MKQPLSKNKRAETRAGEVIIYLVDDQTMLLDLAEIALKGSGYQLRKFQDPEQAHKAFAQARTKPALLISDYAMGKMNGMDFLTKCKQIDPTVKTILVSGTVGPEVFLNAPIQVDQFIAKPYQLEALAEKVRGLLSL